MKKSVLILTSGMYPKWEEVERLLLAKGFQTLRLRSVSEAAYRLDNERFSVIVCEDDNRQTRQSELYECMASKPFAAITPVVIVGSETQAPQSALISSLLDQYFHNSVEPDILVEFICETDSVRGQKAKRAKIGPVLVPEILHHAAKFKFSGAIVLERSDEKCAVYLENGYLVFASSNRDENRFGEFLVTRGIISREQLLRAIEVMKVSSKRMGRILIDEGYLKPQVLQTLLQSQIKHIVFMVFDWMTGEFCILPEEHLDHEKAVAHVEIAPLILEGVRFKFDEPLLNRQFEPFHYRVSLALALDEIQRRLSLGRDALDFLRLVGSGRAIGDLLTLNSYSRLEALKFLFAFKLMGFLSFEAGAVPAHRDFPTRPELNQALSELFSDKLHSTPVQESSRAAIPAPIMIKGRTRAWRLMYMTAGAGALSLALFVFTFLDLRSSRVGVSTELESFPSPKIQALSNESAVTGPSDPIVDEVKVIEVTKTAPEVPKEVDPFPKPKPVREPIKVAMVEKSLSAPSAPLRSALDPFQELLKSAERDHKARKYADALEKYRKAYEAKPGDLTVNLAMGDVLFDLGRNYECSPYYERARMINPQDPRAHVALGTVFLLTGDRIKAKEAYEAFLQVAHGKPAFSERIVEVKKILRSLN